MKVFLPICLLGLPTLSVGATSAAEVRVVAGYAIAAPLQKLATQFEKTSSYKFVFRFGTAPQLVDRLRDPAPFDLVVVPSDVLKDSVARARLAPGSRDIVHVGLAVAVRAGSPRPDISTPEALRRALLSARSIATLPASATGARILQILDELGIADSVRGKILAQPTPAQVVQAVASGKAELALFLSSVLTAPGVDVVGPFPDGLQQEIFFTAGLAAHARVPQAAKGFLRYLQSPAAMAVFKSDGMTPD